MRRLLFFIAFTSAFAAGLAISQLGRYRDVYRSICDLTADHFYKDNERLDSWIRVCRQQAAQLPLGLSADKLMTRIQDHMNELRVSHFSIYSPDEDRKLWKGEAVDTGIRSHYVEEHLVIYRVLPGSSALKAGVRSGDEVVAIPGAEQVTPWGAEHRAGEYVLSRAGKPFRVQLTPTALRVDFSPQIFQMAPGVGMLRISSFRSEYFEASGWKGISSQFSKYRHVIIDVRENMGGNFVAMLRALSSFMCNEQMVGHIVQPRKLGTRLEAFADATEDAQQLDVLEKYHSIGLRTFKGYGCYDRPVTILIGPETTSVAEIFADSFKSRAKSRVWGQPTAGDVVLAVWYDLPAMGPGYSFSIPQAVYINRDKKELEGEGVYPQKDLFYDLQESLQGRDSWVEEVLRTLPH